MGDMLGGRNGEIPRPGVLGIGSTQLDFELAVRALRRRELLMENRKSFRSLLRSDLRLFLDEDLLEPAYALPQFDLCLPLRLAPDGRRAAAKKLEIAPSAELLGKEKGLAGLGSKGV